MLKGKLIQPQIVAALGKAGHSSKILISDGNYPHGTKRGERAEIVYLNLAPGLVTVTDVVKAIISAVAIEKAEVMDYAKTGPNALKEDPPIWNEFRQILHDNNLDMDVEKVERFAFYEAAGTKDVCLTVATGDQRIYANILLTIGVIKPT